MADIEIDTSVTDAQRANVNDALLAYWTSRDEAAVAQAARGVNDYGNRAGVTAGGHLDRVAQLLGRICIAVGAPKSQVFYNAPRDDPEKKPGAAVGYTLPGYYRPTKQWDVVVYHDQIPIVIIELKSQNGPSYGNNANNRAEEALGNAVDLAKAIEQNLIPGDPWTGYVFVIEDDAESQKISSVKEKGKYPKDGLFTDWSYLSRIRHLCQRLLEENLYSAVWAVATSRPNCPSPKDLTKCPQVKNDITPHRHEFGWRHLDPAVSGYAHFVEALEAQIKKYYPDGPKPEAPAVRVSPRTHHVEPDKLTGFLF